MTKQYKSLSKQIHIRGDYQICPLRYKDIFLIKKWRNEQIDVLRQKELLTDEGQKNYYHKTIEPLFEQKQPSQILVSYLKNGELIGYGGLTNIHWNDKRAELSFLVDTQFTLTEELYVKVHSNYLELIKALSFDTLQFNRIFTETFDIRDLHISNLEQAGFLEEGRMKEHIWINGKFVDSILHGYLKKYYNVER